VDVPSSSGLVQDKHPERPDTVPVRREWLPERVARCIRLAPSQVAQVLRVERRAVLALLRAAYVLHLERAQALALAPAEHRE
jgi:hypothetical protein